MEKDNDSKGIKSEFMKKAVEFYFNVPNDQRGSPNFLYSILDFIVKDSKKDSGGKNPQTNSKEADSKEGEKKAEEREENEEIEEENFFSFKHEEDRGISKIFEKIYTNEIMKKEGEEGEEEEGEELKDEEDDEIKEEESKKEEKFAAIDEEENNEENEEEIEDKDKNEETQKRKNLLRKKTERKRNSEEKYEEISEEEGNWSECPIIRRKKKFLFLRKMKNNFSFHGLGIVFSSLKSPEPRTNIEIIDDYNLVGVYADCPCICKKCCINVWFRQKKIPMLRTFQNLRQMRQHIKKERNHSNKDSILNVCLDKNQWIRIKINKQNNYYFIKKDDFKYFENKKNDD